MEHTEFYNITVGQYQLLDNIDEIVTGKQKRVEEIVEDYRKLFSNNNKRYFTGL